MNNPAPKKESAKKPTTPRKPRTVRGSQYTETEIAAQETEVMDRLMIGQSWRNISAGMGLPPSVARDRLTSALNKRIAMQVDEYRIIIGEQLDYLYSRLTNAINNGDTKAILTALQVLDRKAKLYGLDAPIKHEVTVESETDREIKALLGDIQRASGAARADLQPIE